LLNGLIAEIPKYLFNRTKPLGHKDISKPQTWNLRKTSQTPQTHSFFECTAMFISVSLTAMAGAYMVCGAGQHWYSHQVRGTQAVKIGQLRSM
jgi:hypothetical protein